MPRFTLQPRQWYAMECLFPDAHRHYSPIWIDRVERLKTGGRLLDLGFYHANYAEGVRDKVYRLRILHRSSGYLLAAREDDGPAADGLMLLLFPVSLGWLREQFPELRLTATEPAALATELDLATARISRPR